MEAAIEIHGSSIVKKDKYFSLLTINHIVVIY